jgi:DNA polymerase-3 subunit delta'
MAFADLPEEEAAVQIFQESLRRDRLAHAYLIASGNSDAAESFALQIAKTLNCEAPTGKVSDGLGTDSCGDCQRCRQIQAHQQADVTWIRPESKSRIITIAQTRSVLDKVHLKAHGAPFKVIIVVAAERMNIQAANAFLKTLEEPPAGSVLLLLTTDPHRLLDTILSRCLRITLSSKKSMTADVEGYNWLNQLCDRTLNGRRGAGTRYHILSEMLACLADKKVAIDEALSASSPLETHEDLEPSLRERYKQELLAAIEAEYRRQRSDLVSLLQWFLRDVWLQSLNASHSLLQFPDLANETQAIAARIPKPAALKNVNIADQLQRQLNTNVQEALAIEVALLKIAL